MKKTTLLFIFSTILFTLSNAQAPANDTCSGAIEIPNIDSICNNIVVTLDGNVNDSGELPAPGCANYLGGDLWYKAVIPSTGGIHIETSETDASIDDSGLAIYTGTCGNLELYACVDDTNPIDIAMEAIDVAYTVGETIYIRVWTYNNAQTGTFNICAKEYTPPPLATNDDCANSTNLPTNSTCITTAGSNNATNSEIGDSTIPHPEPDEDCGYYLGRDVWYNVTVPSTGHFAIETSQLDGTSIEDTGVAIYSGNCDPNGLTFVACNDDAAIGNTLYSRIELDGRTPGETLFVRVWSWGNEELGTFNICAIELPTLSSEGFELNSFTIFPNPAKDVVYLKFDRTQIDQLNIFIYNIQGKLVLNSAEAVHNDKMELDISGLTAGIYFITAKNDKHIWNQKLIVK